MPILYKNIYTSLQECKFIHQIMDPQGGTNNSYNLEHITIITLIVVTNLHLHLETQPASSRKTLVFKRRYWFSQFKNPIVYFKMVIIGGNVYLISKWTKIVHFLYICNNLTEGCKSSINHCIKLLVKSQKIQFSNYMYYIVY